MIASAMINPQEHNALEPGARQAGVTLIELLTVLVIISIMAVGSTIAFRSFTRSSGIDGATRSVASTLSQCRQYAITHRESIRFVYSNAYSNAASADDFIWGTYEVRDVWGNVLLGPRLNPFGIKFDKIARGRETNMTFQSDGSLDGVDEEIVLTEDVPSGANAASKTVSVNRMTGFIRVLSGH